MSLKSPVFLLIFLIGHVAFSQTVIKGTATDWAGKSIRLYQLLDPISGKENELSHAEIGPDGSFALNCDVKETTMLWIAVKRYAAPIFVNPGRHYQIVILPKPENKLVDTWLKGSFEYGFQNLDSTDVNSILGDFDNAYFNFYLDNAQLINSPVIRKKIDVFERDFISEKDSDDFIEIYRESTIGEMKLSAGAAANSIYETYLQNRIVHPENSAWYSLFDLFYADYFQNFDSKFGGASIPNRIKIGMTPDSLLRTVDLDPFMTNDTLKQWVLLKSIDEVSENKAYPKSFLIESLHLIEQDAETPEISKVAARLIAKIDNQLIGNSLASVLSGCTPEYVPTQTDLPQLLMVSSRNGTESVKEKRLLESLSAEYGGVFAVIEVEIDASSIREEKNWPLYRPESDFTFLETFGIYALPYFIWVDADGNISEVGIEKPSDGLESRLFKLKSKKAQDQKIKVGQ